MSKLQIINSYGQVTPAFELIEMLGGSPVTENTSDDLDSIHFQFTPEIDFINVSLTYPGKSTPAFSNVTLKISPGVSVAVVGPSVAGKTTVIDVILSVLKPGEGKILLSGIPPLFAVAKWPGAVSYVHQDVVIASETFRENISLGYPPDVVTDELTLEALRIAHLDNFVSSLLLDLETQIEEHSKKLSGGQLQRLGIARAMFTRPNLAVIDEATSSLDDETESNISEAILNLLGSTTVVLISHRLSTVRSKDLEFYIDKGQIMAQGTFDEVRTPVPDFDHQAKLMGF